MWWKERRPEIVAAFNREILGEAPTHLPKVIWSVVNSEQQKRRWSRCDRRRLAGQVDNSSYPQISVTIDAILITPTHAAGPVPVIVSFAFPADFNFMAAGQISDPGGLQAIGGQGRDRPGNGLRSASRL